jgi:CRISPR/Cas system-associated protein endoribonuclease Cas2
VLTYEARLREIYQASLLNPKKGNLEVLKLVHRIWLFMKLLRGLFKWAERETKVSNGREVTSFSQDEI